MGDEHHRELVDIVAKLVGFASRADLDDPEETSCLEEFRQRSDINRLHWRDWDQVTESLSNEELVHLLKALTVAENRLTWLGGSVAACIWVFRELERRDLLLSLQLADWILPRTGNPYVPFGRPNFGARSVEEYRR